MSPATIKRRELGLKPIAVDLPVEAWRAVKFAATNSNPPLSQGEFLRRYLANAKPLDLPPQTGEAPQPGGVEG